MSNKPIYLITRGDDCGSSHTANMAIMEACKQGILKNTSIMVPCSKFIEAAEMFANEKDLCFGLHVTLNAEWDSVKWGPVLPYDKVPSLVDQDGNFFQTTMQLYNNKPKLEEIMAEIQAQLDMARDHGFDIRYADTHMGFTWVLDGLADEFDRWCKREGLVNGNKYMNNRLCEKMEGDKVECMLSLLKGANPGLYLVVGHPGYDNEELRALGHEGHSGYEVAKNRDFERRIFMDSRILDYCRNNDVIPIRYDEADKFVK